jgi:hypothetical protein
MDENAKRTAIKMIEGLPEDASYEDIIYGLYVLEKVEAGIRDVEENGVIPHEEVVRSLKTWQQSAGAE